MSMGDEFSETADPAIWSAHPAEQAQSYRAVCTALLRRHDLENRREAAACQVCGQPPQSCEYCVHGEAPA